MDSQVSHLSTADLWLTYLAQGGSIKELRGLDSKQLNTMYKVGHARFCSALYNDSLLIFKHLCILDHNEYRYFLSLGITQIQLRHFSHAVATLSYTETLELTDPRASLAMAGCFMELKRLPQARQALVTAINRAEKSRHWQQELLKAERLMQCIGTGRV